MDTVEDGLFDYDLGFGEQQLIPNSQVITSSSQTPCDFPKQTPLNSTAVVKVGRSRRSFNMGGIKMWRVETRMGDCEVDRGGEVRELQAARKGQNL